MLFLILTKSVSVSRHHSKVIHFTGNSHYIHSQCTRLQAFSSLLRPLTWQTVPSSRPSHVLGSLTRSSIPCIQSVKVIIAIMKCSIHVSTLKLWLSVLSGPRAPLSQTLPQFQHILRIAMAAQRQSHLPAVVLHGASQQHRLLGPIYHQPPKPLIF